MTDMITPDLVRLDADLGSRQGRPSSEPLAGVVASAGRTTQTDQLVDRRPGSGGDLPDRAARRHRDPALPLRGRRRADPGLRPAVPHGRVRRQGRPRRPGVPHRRARGWGRHPPQGADPAGPGPGQGGVHRRPAGGRARPRRSSPWSTRWCRTRSRWRPPRPPRGARGGGCRRLRRPPAARRSLVAVTACPTGIAHTYMAAESLERAAGRGRRRHPRRDPGVGRRHRRSTTATIAGAAAVIFACDVGVRDRSRFAGLPMVSSGVKRAIDDPDGMIADALRYADRPGCAAGRGHGRCRRRPPTPPRR